MVDVEGAELDEAVERSVAGAGAVYAVGHAPAYRVPGVTAASGRRRRRSLLAGVLGRASSGPGPWSDRKSRDTLVVRGASSANLELGSESIANGKTFRVSYVDLAGVAELRKLRPGYTV